MNSIGKFICEYEVKPLAVCHHDQRVSLYVDSCDVRPANGYETGKKGLREIPKIPFGRRVYQNAVLRLLPLHSQP